MGSGDEPGARWRARAGLAVLAGVAAGCAGRPLFPPPPPDPNQPREERKVQVLGSREASANVRASDDRPRPREAEPDHGPFEADRTLIQAYRGLVHSVQLESRGDHKVKPRLSPAACVVLLRETPCPLVHFSWAVRDIASGVEITTRGDRRQALRIKDTIACFLAHRSRDPSARSCLKGLLPFGASVAHDRGRISVRFTTRTQTARSGLRARVRKLVEGL